ncbi:MAG TPA: hypothetical protein VD931_16385 [Baekduia sp.]|nr:hypothetical protein [Baekduia sp.]
MSAALYCHACGHWGGPGPACADCGEAEDVMFAPPCEDHWQHPVLDNESCVECKAVAAQCARREADAECRGDYIRDQRKDHAS